MKALRSDLRTGRFWRWFFINALAAVGTLVTGIELVNFFWSGKVVAAAPWLFPAIVAGSAVFGLWRAWPRPIRQTYSSPSTTIHLKEGDLFAQEGHVVVGACDTFDTAFPFIAKTSVQGQFLDKVFQGDAAELDLQLKAALSSDRPIGRVTKPGKNDRYEIGTVATLRGDGKKFFLVAYTEMNERNEARGTVDGIWKSLSNLWSEVRAQSNGGVVCIPIIGGGQSRISQILPIQDSVRFVILSFMLASRQEKVCDELRIVARPGEYGRLDRLELQAFLSSLRAS